MLGEVSDETLLNTAVAMNGDYINVQVPIELGPVETMVSMGLYSECDGSTIDLKPRTAVLAISQFHDPWSLRKLLRKLTKREQELP